MICDLAETYGVLDYEALPPLRVAVLFLGLREDARVKMRLAAASVSVDRMISALIADRLGWLVWSKTEDAKHGRNRPTSILEQLIKPRQEKPVRSFRSGQEFEQERKRIIDEVRRNA